MGSFNYDIPQEYLDSDFGFTTVDADEFNRQHQVEGDISREVAGEVSDSLVAKILQVESKIDAVITKLNNQQVSGGEDSNVDLRLDLQRIEEKVDNIVSMETNELSRAIQDQGEGIRAIIDEVEERKSGLEIQYKTKLEEVEKLVLPLMINLTKNPDQEYLYWPDRASKVRDQINRILTLTRGG